MKSSEKWRHFCKIIFQPLFYRLSASLLAYKWPTFFQSFIYSKTFIELASFLKQNFALLQKTATSDERFATLHKSTPRENAQFFFSICSQLNQIQFVEPRGRSVYKTWYDVFELEPELGKTMSQFTPFNPLETGGYIPKTKISCRVFVDYTVTPVANFAIEYLLLF